MGLYGAPAFARRARNVQEAWDQLVAACRRRREECRKPVRACVRDLLELTHNWSAVRVWLEDDGPIAVLAELPPAALSPSSGRPSSRKLRKAVEELREAVERFN